MGVVKMYKRYFNLLFLLFVLLASGVFAKGDGAVMYTLIDNQPKEIVVVIDPGHGGFDPGKVGVNNALEKDINLSIAKKLKVFLEMNDIEVLMIRDEDRGLYEEADKNKKTADMKKRVELINKSKAMIAISIHQNSYITEEEKGAQVFYHNASKEGEGLANIIQNQIKTSMKDGNRRVAKANDSYYMLKKTSIPLAIVECGFLSNMEEANLLCDDYYQEKMAWAIHLGIMIYINQEKP